MGAVQEVSSREMEVHIKVAHSLDTDSFLLALRRLIARGGQVREMRSENGTSFISGERELRESI